MVRGAPEPGQLVEVRRRHWIVADVQAGKTQGDTVMPQHRVTLSSVDEDSHGTGRLRSSRSLSRRRTLGGGDQRRPEFFAGTVS